MKSSLDKSLGCMSSSSTQNLHNLNSMKLQKYDDFLSTSHHHQSVHVPNDKYKSQIVGAFASQNRVDAIPIGPQKTKSQVQANQKKNDVQIPLNDEDMPSEETN
jgi:hypothetical protein